MTAGQVNPWPLLERIRREDPDLVRDLAVAGGVLEAVAQAAREQMEEIHPLSCRFDALLHRLADPEAPGADELREEVAERLGLGMLYRYADLVRDAHPDFCRCAERGCAALLAGRAD